MIGLIVGAFLSLSSAYGQDLDAENDPAVFRHQVDQLNERYEDFFSHEQRLKLYEDNLKRSIPELKQQRQTYQREALEAMRLHRQQRRDRPDDTMMEQEDERNKKAEQAVQERHRREYISRRDQLSRISESARKIPANRDAGLE